ncbi:MAG: hypothetical protein ACRDL7_03305, partial [Gaiellaceae bacterium]
MKVVHHTYHHGCSTATDRDERDELGAHKFIKITASSVGRRHLSKFKKLETYTTKQPSSGCFTWRQNEVKPKPRVGPISHSPYKSRRGASFHQKKLPSNKAGGSKEAGNFQSALVELERQNEFQRSVRYLKAHRWFYSLPGCIDEMLNSKKQLYDAMSQRKELLRRLNIITTKLSDNRKDIIMISRMEEERVKGIGKRNTNRARTTGSHHRHSPVQRDLPPIHHYHRFGGRSPLPNAKCFPAKYQHPSHSTMINGEEYHRTNGYLTTDGEFLTLDKRRVMKTNGQCCPKQTQKTHREQKKRWQEKKAEPRKQMPTAPHHPTCSSTAFSDDIITTAATEIIEAIINALETAPSNFSHPHEVATLTPAAQGNLKDDNNSKYHPQCEDLDDNSVEIINTYYDSDEDSTCLPTKVEWARMVSVSSAPEQNNVSSSTNQNRNTNRFRRFISPFNRANSLPPALATGNNQIDVSTIRPNNITVEANDSIRLTNSNLSPMSDSNRATPIAAPPD